MMDNFDISLFYEESFVEFIVTSTKFDSARKIISIVTKGAWLDLDDNNLLNKANILIADWYALKVSVMDDSTKVFSEVEDPNKYKLKDIIKFNNNENILCLTGFGENGGWVQWEFIKPKVVINGNVESNG